jgi:hypothetical protein
VALTTNSKQPYEELDFSFDFSNRGFAAGVTIASVASIVSVLSSGPAGNLTVSGTTFSGLACAARFSGGLTGSKHKVTAKVVMSDGEKAECDGYISVKEL